MVAHHAAQRIADHAGKEDAGRIERRLLQVLLVVLVEERRNPAQEQPQRPAVAEIDRGHRQHAAKQLEPRHRRVGAGCGCGPAARQAPRRVSGGVAGTSRKYHDHSQDPDEAQQRQHDERAAPRHQLDQQGDQRRRRPRCRSAQKEWVMPWAKPQLRSGVHTAMARVAVGKVAPSPMPSASRAANRLDEAADRAGRRRRHANDQAADAERQARPEFVAEIAADQLKQRVRIGERRKDQPKLGIAQAEIGLDQRRGGRDVDPIHIEDQVHQAEDQQIPCWRR